MKEGVEQVKPEDIHTELLSLRLSMDNMCVLLSEVSHLLKNGQVEESNE